MTKVYQPTVELMDLDKIHPYAANAKIHTDAQVDSLVKVIKSQGWDVPIVVDKDGVVIKGHGRRLAALRMGLKKVPVIVRRDLSEAEVKAARLSDNRVAMGDFDIDAIKDELSALKSDGFDLTNMGFGEKEVEMMLGDLDKVDFAVFDEPKPSEPEATPEVTPESTKPAKPVKALALDDLLGFKHVPGEYRADIVAFQTHAEEASGKQGAEAFCHLIASLLKGMRDET